MRLQSASSLFLPLYLPLTYGFWPSGARRQTSLLLVMVFDNNNKKVKWRTGPAREDWFLFWSFTCKHNGPCSLSLTSLLKSEHPLGFRFQQLMCSAWWGSRFWRRHILHSSCSLFVCCASFSQTLPPRASSQGHRSPLPSISGFFFFN